MALLKLSKINSETAEDNKYSTESRTMVVDYEYQNNILISLV